MPAEPTPTVRSSASKAGPRARFGHACFVALAGLVAVALGAPAANAAESRYEGISANGDVAFFSTTDKLVPGDTDIRRDIYERSFDEVLGGYVTRQVSTGPAGGNNAYDAQYLGVDEAGARVFFSTGERLADADTDNTLDIYVRDVVENETELISAGDPSCAESDCGNANSAVSAVTDGVVADGTEVFFASEEQLAAEDSDAGADIYVRDLLAETTTLVSAGGPQPAFFQGASEDGTRAFFTTEEALVEEDADGGLIDLYARDLEGGETELVSTPGACPEGLDCTPVYGGASGDGSHVFFETNEQISGLDTDSHQDVYDWSGGAAGLVSTGPDGGNGTFNALYAGSSADGADIFFETNEQLDAGADTDNAQDVYERTGGTTALVSAGAAECAPGCGNGDGLPASLRWASPTGSVVLFSTLESLAGADEDTSVDIYGRSLPGGPTTLVSQAGSSCAGPECGNGPHNVNLAGVSGGGSHVFFVTEEQLVEDDGDARTDVYDRSGGETTLISAGSINGNGPYDAQLQGVSEDGSRAFVVTKERLTDEDDFAGEEDIYSRTGTITLLVSQGNDAELESKLAPPPPILERTDPASPNASTEPRVIGSEPEAAASIKLYTTPDCSGEPVATGGAEQLAEPGIAVGVESGTTTDLRATAEAEGFTSACSEPPLSYTQEAPAPPPPPEGGSGGGGGGGGSAPPLPAPAPAPAPAARGGSGVLYVAPVTRITFGPAFKTRARRPVFRFTDSTGQPGTRFVCRVDRRRWKGCDSPTRLKGLKRGRHLFRVKAVNAVGVWERRVSKRPFKLVRRGGKHRKHRRHTKRGRR